jgi:hypothetical protein
VSDQIENEDMLDGAYESGKERKEEEEQKDVPEEDNGIEMSEDFDSHLQAREGVLHTWPVLQHFLLKIAKAWHAGFGSAFM